MIDVGEGRYFHLTFAPLYAILLPIWEAALPSFHLFTREVGVLATNCYILAAVSSRALVIDPGGGADELLALLRQHGLSLGAVLLTHGHFDHFLAADSLLASAERAGMSAEFLVPALDAPLLTDPAANGSRDLFAADAAVSHAPTRLLAEGDIVPLDGAHSLRVLATPGHTAGSLTYCMEALPDELDRTALPADAALSELRGCLFPGDLIFRGSAGRTDLMTGDEMALLRSLARLKNLPGDFLVFPGHGEMTTLSRERARNPFLRAL